MALLIVGEEANHIALFSLAAFKSIRVHGKVVLLSKGTVKEGAIQAQG